MSVPGVLLVEEVELAGQDRRRPTAEAEPFGHLPLALAVEVADQYCQFGLTFAVQIAQGGHAGLDRHVAFGSHGLYGGVDGAPAVEPVVIVQQTKVARSLIGLVEGAELRMPPRYCVAHCHEGGEMPAVGAGFWHLTDPLRVIAVDQRGVDPVAAVSQGGTADECRDAPVALGLRTFVLQPDVARLVVEAPTLPGEAAVFDAVVPQVAGCSIYFIAEGHRANIPVYVVGQD